jgi:hypothetical protein
MCDAQPAPQSSSYHHIQEVATMINFRPWRIATAAAILTMLAGSVAVPAAAYPLDPDPAPHRSIAFPDSPRRCPLHRIDRQLVRCDNLTGAGVPAPLFIPEL